MVRNKYELELMRISGRISAQALKEVLENVEIGISCLELNKMAEERINSLGGAASFKMVPDYRWASCITINEQVVHGIPTDRKIKVGDLVSIDLGTVYRGWHTDCAWSILVGHESNVKEYEAKNKFLQVGEQAMWDGIDQVVAGNRIGDISHAIQTRVEGAGYLVVRSLVGHGIGRNLHEEPEVPGYGIKKKGMVLKEGMSLAIEAIYAQGTSEVILDSDGWTFKTVDGSLAGLFEMTVIVGREKAEVLTDWRYV